MKILITENSKPTRSAGHDARYVIDMSRPPQCVILIWHYLFLVQTKILATSSSIEEEVVLDRGRGRPREEELLLDRGRARLRSKTNQPTHKKTGTGEILLDEISVS